MSIKLLIPAIFAILIFHSCFLKKETSPDCKVDPTEGYSCKSTQGQTFSPVCGCDSHTYYNACSAGYSVRVAHNRPCNTAHKKDTVTYLGTYKFLKKDRKILTLELKNYVYDEFSQWGIFKSQVHNYIGKKFILSYLVLGDGSASSGSVYHDGAVIIGSDCPDTFQPVCGDDGITYVNSCYADHLKKTYTNGACPSSVVTDSLRYVGDYKFETSNKQAITFTKTYTSQDNQGLYAYYNQNTKDIGTSSQINYLKAVDDYFEYYYFK